MKPSLFGYIIDTYAQQTAGQTGAQFRINFDYFPESYHEGKHANYASIDIMGRSEPVRGYFSSGSRTLRINFKVGIDAIKSLNPGKNAYQVANVNPTYGTAFGGTTTITPAQASKASLLLDKQGKCNFLMSLAYPNYATGIGMIQAPPPVLVVIGSYFAMLGIVTDVEFTHIAPYDFDTGISHWTEVSLAIEEAAANPFSYLEVKQGKLGQATLPNQT